jgi:predicted nucleotidyltransferase component of viral defense system
MTARVLKNPAASVRMRLLNHARENGDQFQRVLTRYAIERLLFRLSQTEAVERYVLKGAMLFVTWPEHVFRPTGDLDLLGHGDPDDAAIVELFTRISKVDLADDGIVFDPTTITIAPIREDEKYQGVRLTVRAELAQADFPVQVDIAFGDHVHPRPTPRTFPGLLAGLPTPTILMYPPETVVAEKLEAMIRFGEANTRVKDYYDMWVTTRIFPFEMAHLVEAINGTLQRRETDLPAETPVGLTDSYAAIVERAGLWAGFLRRNPPTLTPPTFPELQTELRRFFAPVLTVLETPERASGSWDPNGSVWRPSRQ